MGTSVGSVTTTPPVPPLHGRRSNVRMYVHTCSYRVYKSTYFLPKDTINNNNNNNNVSLQSGYRVPEYICMYSTLYPVMPDPRGPKKIKIKK